MTRILSALVLLPIVLGTILLAPPWMTLVLALVILALAVHEFLGLAARPGDQVLEVLVVAVAAAVAATLALRPALTGVVMLLAPVVLGAATLATTRADRDVARVAGISVLAVVYIGLPLGALAALRTQFAAEVLLLLLFTVMASDTGQYYGGRAFGRTPLAPAVSPKKTLEGALAGFVVGTVVFVLLARLWLVGLPMLLVLALGPTLVALGIVGDLFESLLKRSADVKDTSTLIPGHGGILDRIDSLLFAAPVFYGVLALVQQFVSRVG